MLIYCVLRNPLLTIEKCERRCAWKVLLSDNSEAIGLQPVCVIHVFINREEIPSRASRFFRARDNGFWAQKIVANS